MTDITRKSDFDDIPLDGFKRDPDPFAKKPKTPKLKVKKEKSKHQRDEKKEGFLPSHTPIPFWLDVLFFFMWCGAVGLSIVTAFFMADLLLGVSVFAGGGAVILLIRTIIKRILLARE